MSSQEKSATLYIIRHGETIGNDVRIFLLPEEDILNEQGKLQAKLLGESLKDVEFTQAIVSPYPRTQETAKIVLAENSSPRTRQLKHVIDNNLGEIGFPNCYGKPYKYILAGLIEFIKSEKDLDTFNLDDSEPVPEARARAKKFVDTLLEKLSSSEWGSSASSSSSSPQVLVVSHGGLIRLMMEVLSETSAFDIQGWDKCGTNVTRNTGLMKLVIHVGEKDKKPKIEFVKLHDFSHYPPEMLETDSLTRTIKTPELSCLSGCFQV